MDARTELRMLLSAYRDGELQGAQKAKVEAALAADASLRAELADWNALAGGVNATLAQAGDELDEQAFLAAVKARLPKAPAPSFTERLAVWWSEMVEFRPVALASGFAAAAVVVFGGSLLVSQSLAPAPAPGGAPLVAEKLPAPAPAPQPLGGGATAVASRTPKASTVREVKPHADTDAVVFENQAGASVIFLRPTRK